MDSMDSGHPFNLNVYPPAESRIEEPNDPNLGFDQRKSDTEEGGKLAEKMSCIERVNMNIMKSLAELLEKYEAMHHQLIDLMKIKSKPNTDSDEVMEEDGDDCELNNSQGKKRKASDPRFDSEEVWCRRAPFINYKPKISTACIRIDESDTSLVVKDGYQWRKYGQKTTRDNPSPRAYYKCSFAPLCPVKKKVQRSVDDTTVVVVTYEGEHNHKKPPSGATLSPSSTELLIEPEDVVEGRMLQPRLLEQMADTLTRDPSFTSALASAIYSKVLQQKSC